MRLRKLKLVDFQGVRHADIEVGGLTMIYGPNGAGKSSIADGLLYGLTGETARGRVLADAIREGAKSLAVKVQCEHASYERGRSKSAGKEEINGAKAKAGGIAESLEQVGISQPHLRAALRSGHLLTMSPADLHALFVELFGVELDAGAIAQAIKENGIARDFEVGEIEQPRSMEDFPSIAATAEDWRRQNKRRLDQLEGDLARLPEAEDPGDDLPDLDALMRRREEALAARARKEGASEARVAELREELARLDALPEWTEADKAKLSDAGDRAAEAMRERDQAQAEIKGLEGDLAELRPAEKKPRLSLEETAQALEERRAEEVEAREELGRIGEEGQRIKALLDRLDGDTCPTCQQDARGLAKQLQAQQADARKRWTKAQAQVDALAGQVEDLERDDHWYRVPLLREMVEQEKAKLAEAQVRIDAAEEEVRALSERRGKLAERSRIPSIKVAIRDAKAALAAEAGEDVAALEEQIREAEAMHEARRTAASRTKLEQEISATEAKIEACDVIAKACGPKGIPALLMAEMLEPFTQLANAHLGSIFPGCEVEVETDGGLSILARVGKVTLAPDQLSDGERTRFLFALQAAVGELAGVKILLLDRCELIDAEGKRLLMRWVSGMVREGWQVVMLSSAPAPTAPQPGIAAYRMEAGRAEAITSEAVA